MWDLTSGETKLELRGHDNVVECAVFAPHNAATAIRELTGIVSAVTIATPLHAYYSFAYVQTTSVRDGKDRNSSAYVLTGSRDKTIRLWDAQSGQCLKSITGHDNWIRALVFHPNGKYFLSASDDKTIRIWEIATGRCTKTIEAHTHFVTCMSWGRMTIAGPVQNGADGTEGVKSEPRLINVLATGSVDQVGLNSD